jgi:hypothetical protein
MSVVGSGGGGGTDRGCFEFFSLPFDFFLAAAFFLLLLLDVVGAGSSFVFFETEAFSDDGSDFGDFFGGFGICSSLGFRSSWTGSTGASSSGGLCCIAASGSEAPPPSLTCSSGGLSSSC